jgi:hypothetical protein
VFTTFVLARKAIHLLGQKLWPSRTQSVTPYSGSQNTQTDIHFKFLCRIFCNKTGQPSFLLPFSTWCKAALVLVSNIIPGIAVHKYSTSQRFCRAAWSFWNPVICGCRCQRIPALLLPQPCCSIVNRSN